MNPLNSGWALLGRDLNSGWYCTPTKKGLPVSSTVSTSLPSGDIPRKGQASPGKDIPIVVIELISVAVTLGYTRLYRSSAPWWCRGLCRRDTPPRRSVPPLSIFSLCPGIKSMTLCLQSSIKFSGVVRLQCPRHRLANSMTAICMPRHMPK